MKRISLCGVLWMVVLSAFSLSPAEAKTVARATPRAKTASATPAPAGAADGADASAVPGGSGGASGGAAVPDPNVVRVAVVGDSTAAFFPEGLPYRGWGEYLQAHYTDAVKVTNYAHKGRTAESFIDQGLWKIVLKAKPDIVLIQFGHNELLASSESGTDQTTALREYRKYLGAMVDTTKKGGALAVVLSPTHHMAVDAEGRPVDQLAPFVEAARQVAELRGAPFIDVHAALQRVYTAMGPDKVKQFQAKPEDPVHFSNTGAWFVAAVIAKELGSVDRRLGDAEKTAPGPLAGTAGGERAAAGAGVARPE